MKALGLGFCLTLALASPPPDLGDPRVLDAAGTIASTFQRLLVVVREEPGTQRVVSEAQQAVTRLFDLDRLAQQVMPQIWPELSVSQRTAFQDALGVSLAKRISRELLRGAGAEIGTLHLEHRDVRERFARLSYVLAGRNARHLTAFMVKNSDGAWRISNVLVGEQSLVRHYYQLCENILGQYSFAYLIAELRDDGFVVLEDFEDDKVGKLPRGWRWKSKDNKKRKPYVVKEENGNKYLAATDEGESVILAKNIKWDIKKYPYISFRWRAHKLPKGGDERFGKTVDSAAGIYIVYRKELMLIPESVKYVWSSTLPVGSTMRRSGKGRPWMIVAESGDEHLDEWRTYVFNIYEAYKKTFGHKPPSRAIGLAILSDANSTKSKAYADYDDIRALREADADSGVKEFLEAE